MADSNNIILVGTGHILEKSVREVEEVIEREKPDIVAVELCQSRYEALKGNVGDFSVKDAIEGGKPFLMLTHWLLAYIQKRMGSELGIEPGAEMMAAIKKAEALGCEVAQTDTDNDAAVLEEDEVPGEDKDAILHHLCHCEHGRYWKEEEANR